MSGHGGGWVAFTLREPLKERLAKRWLTNAGFRAELPEITRQQRKRHGNRGWITRRYLALPGYVFVHVAPDACPGHTIANARAAVAALGRPVGMAGAPLLIADGWIEQLLLPHQTEAEYAWRPPPGSIVALSGPWGGYKGRVVSVTDGQVRVIVEALHRALSMTLPVGSVRLAA